MQLPFAGTLQSEELNTLAYIQYVLCYDALASGCLGASTNTCRY